MMAIKRKGLVCILLASLAGLAGCSSSNHIAYVTLGQGNTIAAFRVDNHSGRLTLVVGSPFNAGNSPISIVVHPSNKFAYAANQIGNDISLFTIDQNTSALTEVGPRAPAGIAPAFLTMDSDGHFLFAANQVSNSISVYSIDATKGSLSEIQGSPFVTGANPVSLAITPSGKFLYVASPNLQSVFGYSISSGALQPVPNSPVLVDVGPVSLAVDPSGHFLYVANFIANTVSVLAIDANSGALTGIPGSPFTTCTSTTTACTNNPVWVAIHPSGKFLYTANKGANNVSLFSINSTTGVPTQITNSTTIFGTGTAPVFASVDSTGRFLYVGNQSSKNITGFSINQSTGSLSSGVVGATTSSAPTSMVTTK
jgi:6-phosphogluconolactonase (cycloisomerase 2 family)